MKTPNSSSYFNRRAWPVCAAFTLFTFWAAFVSVAPGQPFMETVTVTAALPNVGSDLPSHMLCFAILMVAPVTTLTAMAALRRMKYRLVVLAVGMLLPFLVLEIEGFTGSFPRMIPATIAAIAGRQVGEFYADGEAVWVTGCWWVTLCLVIAYFEARRSPRGTEAHFPSAQSC